MTVAQLLHRGEAARQLGVSVRTLARHLAELEQELGVLLMARTRQRTALTPTGVWLRDALTGPLAQADAALREASRRTMPSLRVAISAELPPTWIGRIGGWVHDSGQSVELELEAPDEALRLLRAGRTFDMALVAGEHRDQPSAVVGYEQTVVVFPEGHPAAALPVIRPGDLRDLPVAVSETATIARRIVVQHLQGDPDAPTVVAPRMATIGQGLLHTARVRGAAALTIASVTALSGTAGLAVRPLDPPYRLPISIVARPDVPAEMLASLAAHLLPSPHLTAAGGPSPPSA